MKLGLTMPISFDTAITATSQQDEPLKTETVCYRRFQEEGYYSEPEKQENTSSVAMLEDDSMTSSPDVPNESTTITDVIIRHDGHNTHDADKLSCNENTEGNSISNDSDELKADKGEFTDQLTQLQKILDTNGNLSLKSNSSEINPVSIARGKSLAINKDRTRTDGPLKPHTRDFNSKLSPDSWAEQQGPRMKEIRSDNVPETSSGLPSGKRRCYRCKQCEYISVIKTDFWEHIKTHIKTEKLLTCPKCPFATEYKHHLEYHLRNHFGSKPFKCPKCSYSCVNKSMLNSHMKSHSNIYQYRCADCSYVTKYCHSLKLHLRKYAHKPSLVLNVDGTLNTNSVIDVYGKKRGPRSKKQNTEIQHCSSSSQSPKTPVLHISPIEHSPVIFSSKSPVVAPSHGLSILKNSHTINAIHGSMSLCPSLLLKAIKSSNELSSGSAPEKTPDIEEPLLSKTNLQPLNCNLSDFTTEIRDLFSKHLIKQHVASNNQYIYKNYGNTSNDLPQIQGQPQMNENQKLEEDAILRNDHSLTLKCHTQMTENLAKNIPLSDFSLRLAESQKFVVPSLHSQKLDCVHTPPMLATALTNHSVPTHQILLTSMSLPLRKESPEIKPDTHFPLDLTSYRVNSKPKQNTPSKLFTLCSVSEPVRSTCSVTTHLIISRSTPSQPVSLNSTLTQPAHLDVSNSIPSNIVSLHSSKSITSKSVSPRSPVSNISQTLHLDISNHDSSKVTSLHFPKLTTSKSLSPHSPSSTISQSVSSNSTILQTVHPDVCHHTSSEIVSLHSNKPITSKSRLLKPEIPLHSLKFTSSNSISLQSPTSSQLVSQSTSKSICSHLTSSQFQEFAQSKQISLDVFKSAHSQTISPTLSTSRPVSLQFSKHSTVDHTSHSSPQEDPSQVPCRNYVSTPEGTQFLSSNFRNPRKRKATKLEGHTFQLSTNQSCSSEDFVKFHKEMKNKILNTKEHNESLSKKSPQCMNFSLAPTCTSSVDINSTNFVVPSTTNASEEKCSSHVKTFTSVCNFDIPAKAPNMTRPVSEPVLAKYIEMPEQPLSFPYQVSSLFFGNNGLNKRCKESVTASNGHYPSFPYHDTVVPVALREIYSSSPHSLLFKQNGTETKKTPSSESEEDSKWQDSYACRYCDLAFKDCVMYTMHMGYHGYQDPFTCNMCGQHNKDKVSFFLHIARVAHQ
ncbi:uncharacterized protein LOC143252578 [Tachypleus tridentatus]|uniref:uncharacterized protein LOC143252578 n=1 Tax=Tachypleus tridentatus TaxID=6853 RepID=UPI003FD36B10